MSNISEEEIDLATPIVTTKKKPAAYDSSSITVLEGREAVRKRPAMYIGSTGDQGLHHLVYEVVDNSIDEALAGYCDTVEVAIHLDNSITVIDNGRVFLWITTRAKKERGGSRDDETSRRRQVRFQRLQSLRRLARRRGFLRQLLSETLRLEIWRDGNTYEQEYERGIAIGKLEQTGTTRKRGTKVTFKPDATIFDVTEFSFDKLSERLREKPFSTKAFASTSKTSVPSLNARTNFITKAASPSSSSISTKQNSAARQAALFRASCRCLVRRSGDSIQRRLR
jgi:DNA gyrase subunit B